MTSRLQAKKAQAKASGKQDNGVPRLKVGGTLIPGKHLYIERLADQELFDLLRKGEYCNILTSRQMGKSSLMARTYRRLIEAGHHAVVADMQLLGSVKSSDEWYQALLEETVRGLELPVDVDAWWRAAREATPELRLLRFFREEVAAKVPGQNPIILFVDEIDGTLDLPFSDDFFLAMRAMYNQRALTPEYDRIVFCPIGVASPNELIKDKKKTPYNIGKLVELRDFDGERDDLSALIQLVGGGETLRRVLDFTGGHPYLTVLVCEKFIREGRRSADEVEAFVHRQFASLDDLTGDAHFGYIQDFLAQRAEDPLAALKLYRQILSGEPVKDQVTPAHIALKLAGIVKRGPGGTLIVRNEIYRRLFNEDWAIRTAQSEAAQLREAAALSSAAEVHEQNLNRTMSYQDADAAHRALKAISVYPGDAAELYSRFFERMALKSEQSERRDEAILWRLGALSSRKNEMRERALNSLITPDYPNLEFSFHHPATGGGGFDPFLANQIIAFSPDGKRIVTAGLDGTARLWSAETGGAIGEPMRHENGVLAVAFSPDGRRVLTGSSDNTARLWSAETGGAIGEPMRHENGVLAVAFSPDGRRVLTGSDDNTARLWSAGTGGAIGEPMRHENWVRAVAFSPDGRRVLTGSDDNTARLWSAETGGAIGEPMRHENGVLAVAFSPDGRRVLTGSSDKTARLWSAETGGAIGEPMRHENGVLAVAFSPDGRRVLTGSSDKTARLWSAETGGAIGEPMRHENWVLAVAFSPDGRRVLTGSSDNTARLWSAETGGAIGEPMRHENWVLAVAFSPDGRRVLTGSSDKTARLWSAETGGAIGEPMRHENWVRAVAFSPDGRRVLTGSDDNTARLWSAETGGAIGEPMRHENGVLAVVFSPDGRRVLTGSDDNTARLWSAETGGAIGEPMRHENWVLAVAFSPDGRRVLTGSSDKTARLWSAETGGAIGEPMRHENVVLAVAFSPDGRRVLTGSSDNTARLWSAETGGAIGEPMRHENVVLAVAFSPDGRRVLTGSDDKTARLWSAETGEALAQPMRHENSVRAVAFSPDGRRVLTGSYDQTARLWSAETGAALGEPMRHESLVLAVAFSPDGRRAFAATQWWLHEAETDDQGWRPVISRLLPGPFRWSAQMHFLDPAGSCVQLGLGVTGDSTRVVRIALDHSDVEPIAGDPARLLGEWQQRLGLKINATGEIVPLWQ